MRHFQKLLYISYGNNDERSGLTQALSLARNNEGTLTVLVLCPEFPKDMQDFKSQYEATLTEHTHKAIEETIQALGLESGQVKVTVVLEQNKTPAVRAIQHVIQGGYDLLIKEAEPRESGKGFKAEDMELLRKSPCPVWLCQPITKHRDQIHVGVAIDPLSEEPADSRLALRMLELSQDLAQTCDKKLNVISCWVFELEQYLRGNVWMKTSDAELDERVLHAQTQHRQALEQVVKDSGVAADTLALHAVRGQPEEQIPAQVEKLGLDILVMGTVARTGIPGFMIGNTAENIVQTLPCSVLALKPRGFTSPVKG